MLSTALARVRSDASTLWVAKKLVTSSRCSTVQKDPVAATTRRRKKQSTAHEPYPSSSGMYSQAWSRVSRSRRSATSTVQLS